MFQIKKLRSKQIDFKSYLSFLIPGDYLRTKKTLLLASLFFLVAFVYNILQPLKKTIIMYCPGAGAEALPYLKPFAIAPSSLLLTWFFLHLNSKYKKDKVFNYMMMFFGLYFFIYTFFLNPYKEALRCDFLADFLLTILPKNFHAAPSIIRYWMHTLFYSFAELWGASILTLLLWGLVNEVSSHDEAKQTYAFFTVWANIAGTAAGKVSQLLSEMQYDPNFILGHTQWEQAFYRIMIVVLACIGLTYYVYRNFYRSFYEQHSEEKNEVHQVKREHKEKTKKEKIGLTDCFKEVVRSRHLTYIAIIVVGYNLVYNLSDVAFNKQIEITFGPENKVQSNAFMSTVQMYTGIISTFVALLISNFCLKNYGWTLTAMITPIGYLVSALFFYVPQINSHVSEFLWMAYPIDPALMTVYLGGIHFSLTKAFKYSLFDSTKEMAYIGLSKEEKINGKAAIDGIASRFGKSGGSFIMFLLIGILGNDVSLTIPYIFGTVLFISVLWIIAIRNLGQSYVSGMQKNTRELGLQSESLA